MHKLDIICLAIENEIEVLVSLPVLVVISRRRINKNEKQINMVPR